jgi:hypothetical protein
VLTPTLKSPIEGHENLGVFLGYVQWPYMENMGAVQLEYKIMDIIFGPFLFSMSWDISAGFCQCWTAVDSPLLSLTLIMARAV